MAEILLGRLDGPAGFEKPVVIKRILPDLVGSQRFAEMFLDEARILARIHHPNVVRVFELGLENGEPFLVMEHLRGESVAGILRRLYCQERRMPPACAALIAAAACAGLHAAHELRDAEDAPLSLVHRDVSPQNLFVTYDGQVQVLDFGVAKAVGMDGRTATGMVKGKAAYMSPEQTQARSLDRRSDLFSLGIVLFEMCTMRRLFDRENNPALTYRAICEQPIPTMAETTGEVPAELDRIVQRALARPLEERYQTALAMRRDLLAAARGLDDREPEEQLATMMRELFAERIAAKTELHRQLSEGTTVDRLPPAEVDLDTEIPIVAPPPKTRGSGATREGRRPRWRRVAGLAAGALALGGVAMVLPGGRTTAPTVPHAAVAAAAAPPRPTPPVAAPPVLPAKPAIAAPAPARPVRRGAVRALRAAAPTAEDDVPAKLPPVGEPAFPSAQARGAAAPAIDAPEPRPFPPTAPAAPPPGPAAPSEFHRFD